jgi:flagellar hook protein FlgE
LGIQDLSLVDANGTTRNLRVWLYYDNTTSRWNYRVFENLQPRLLQTQMEETGATLLASGDLSDETNIYFFLDGTTQRVNLDWTAVTNLWWDFISNNIQIRRNEHCF